MLIETAESVYIHAYIIINKTNLNVLFTAVSFIIGVLELSSLNELLYHLSKHIYVI